MADRKNFYFGQLVGQADLDGAFDYVENADRALMVDHGLVGITQGLGVTPQAVPNLTVNVAGGAGYDQLGRRILVGGTQVVDLSAAQPVGGGTSKIVSVCIRFDRALSDQRTDDNSVNLFYEQAESFEIFLVEGAEVVGVPAAPAKPANALLLADVTLNQGDTQIVAGDIDMTTDGRRDWAFEIVLGALPDVKVGTLLEVVTANRQTLNDHISSLALNHPADTISFDNVTTGLAATDVQAAIDEILQGGGGVQMANDYTFDGALTIPTGTLVGTMPTLRGRYTFSASAVAVTNGSIGTVAIPDDTAVLLRWRGLAWRTTDSAQTYAITQELALRRTGGGSTQINATLINQLEDDTAAAAAVGTTLTATGIDFGLQVAAGTWNVAFNVEVLSP